MTLEALRPPAKMDPATRADLEALQELAEDVTGLEALFGALGTMEVVRAREEPRER